MNYHIKVLGKQSKVTDYMNNMQRIRKIFSFVWFVVKTSRRLR